MNTFMEFYDVLLKFVMFKLYTDLNIKYPPEFVNLDGGLIALKIVSENNYLNERISKVKKETASRKINEVDNSTMIILKDKLNDIAIRDKKATEALEKNKIKSELESINIDEENMDIEEGFMVQTKEGSEIFKSQNMEDERRKVLFQGMKFFLNREVPKYWLEFIILSCGGVVGWEGIGSPFAIDDPTITHHIVDRPKISSKNFKGREIVQPQWILDSINNRIILPVERYKIGKSLPPHLSPFVEEQEGLYIPVYKQEIDKIKMNKFSHNNYLTNIKIEDEKVKEDQYSKEIELEAQGIKSMTLKSQDNIDSNAGNTCVVEFKEENKKTLAINEIDGNDEIALLKKRKNVSLEKEVDELKKLMMKKKAKRLYGKLKGPLDARKKETLKLKRKRELIETFKRKFD
eukprot:CAMPEP_0171457962 /NCGR_PEP_ID=MMETSP0945-20130129/3827_1 /TAXON_ID=109269 /ORGANISM="Vaucheria litorea, Strain CCMP2940" /LENGTH=403 /DNA_ID=CAMNT_0011983667 /DNA_START=380 /DNA_END=1588 /DNA_ORIENTATION=-